MIFSERGCLLIVLPKSLETMVSPRAFIVRLASGVLLVNLFIVALAWVSLYQSRHHYKERVVVQAQNLSQALEFTIVGIIDKADLVLLAMVDEAERQVAGGGINEHALNSYIARQHTRVPELNGLRMTNARGDVIFGTSVVPGNLVNVNDRDYYMDARDNRKGELFISKPVFGRVAKQWVLVIARRVNNPDGSFAGVAYGSLSIEYFVKLFSTFNVGRLGSITLRDGEFAVVARYPEPQGVGSTIGSKSVTQEFLERLRNNRTTGTYTAHAAIDNIERTFSYRMIAHYPLYVIVGLASSDYLAEWWRDAAKILALVSLFTIGTLVSAVFVFRSWMGKQQALEELKQYHEHLEELIKERTTDLEAFNYTVTHDLRRPLSNINAYCQVIMELWGDTLDGQCKGYIQGAHDETERMNQLIDALLNFSRMTHKELQREDIDLSAMAMDVALSLQLREPNRKITFECTEGLHVNGDPSLLRMVMENILSNAWKFTSKQEEAIIEFGVMEEAGVPAYFVRDNGTGIDMNYAEKLFEPFQRLPGTDEYQGHGIGLATVEKIIKRHGGKVWAEGSPGKGATIYFTL
jgi:signal transduction histidine kinase